MIRRRLSLPLEPSQCHRNCGIGQRSLWRRTSMGNRIRLTRATSSRSGDGFTPCRRIRKFLRGKARAPARRHEQDGCMYVMDRHIILYDIRIQFRHTTYHVSLLAGRACCGVVRLAWDSGTAYGEVIWSSMTCHNQSTSWRSGKYSSPSSWLDFRLLIYTELAYVIEAAASAVATSRPISPTRGVCSPCTCAGTGTPSAAEEAGDGTSVGCRAASSGCSSCHQARWLGDLLLPLPHY
jgi:hypothetical protein